ncbi:hypothetical protein, partial [Brevibacillus porteri]|nr:hypothetical protein [Brevibacillus porteri]
YNVIHYIKNYIYQGFDLVYYEFNIMCREINAAAGVAMMRKIFVLSVKSNVVFTFKAIGKSF